MGLFYYAGHGVQVGGNNYLVPVKAVIQSESDVKYGCLDAGLVLGKMEDAGNGLNLIILDACRNNPFARSFRSAEQGLAKMDAPTGSLIAYATSPGKTAADGDGKNGLYTQHLLKNIATPGLSVEELFKRVRQGVAGDSAKKQVPWEASSLIGQFSFAGGEHTASLPTATSTYSPYSPPAPAPAAPAAKPLDLKAEKKRVADEAAQLKREQDELAQLQSLQAEKARLDAERQKVEQAKLLAMSPGPQKAPGAAPASGSPGQTWRDPTTGMEFVWVPGGSFEMGCGSWGGECKDSEKPVHSVRLSGFWLGKYEVTQGQWSRVMGNNPSIFKKGDNYPVEQVSWNDVKEFITKLNAQGSAKFRLPTEAEWEYAARSGGRAEKYAGGGDDIDRVAWYTSNSGSSTHAVGTKAPNGLGLYDMSGNVFEWVEDVYGSYSSSSQDNPVVTGGGSYRVFRGGSWGIGPGGVRSANRANNTPDFRLHVLGFRLARTN